MRAATQRFHPAQGLRWKRRALETIGFSAVLAGRPPVDEEQWRTALLAQARFYKGRMVDPYFEPPPDNRYLRKAVKSHYPDTGAYHHVGWTLHPRYFAKLFKCKIVYEFYPEGQAEVDEMVTRLRIDARVIYDPQTEDELDGEVN
jgi:hypothetical protein